GVAGALVRHLPGVRQFGYAGSSSAKISRDLDLLALRHTLYVDVRTFPKCRINVIRQQTTKFLLIRRGYRTLRISVAGCAVLFEGHNTHSGLRESGIRRQ